MEPEPEPEPEPPLQQQKVSQFCTMCGVHAVTAQQHLEAAGWDVQAAVGSYFAAQEPEPEPQPAPQPQAAAGQVVEFGATGSIVECTVPEGATDAGIEACGAQGGGSTGSYTGARQEGGRGARRPGARALRRRPCHARPRRARGLRLPHARERARPGVGEARGGRPRFDARRVRGERRDVRIRFVKPL